MSGAGQNTDPTGRQRVFGLTTLGELSGQHRYRRSGCFKQSNIQSFSQICSKIKGKYVINNTLGTQKVSKAQRAKFFQFGLEAIPKPQPRKTVHSLIRLFVELR